MDGAGAEILYLSQALMLMWLVSGPYLEKQSLQSHRLAAPAGQAKRWADAAGGGGSRTRRQASKESYSPAGVKTYSQLGGWQ